MSFTLLILLICACLLVNKLKDKVSQLEKENITLHLEVNDLQAKYNRSLKTARIKAIIPRTEYAELLIIKHKYTQITTVQPNVISTINKEWLDNFTKYINKALNLKLPLNSNDKPKKKNNIYLIKTKPKGDDDV